MAGAAVKGQFDHLSDEELAVIVIDRIASLEKQGARLPVGWRHQPISLSYLDALYEIALEQIKPR